jgi:hypothetical protein
MGDPGASDANEKLPRQYADESTVSDANAPTSTEPDTEPTARNVNAPRPIREFDLETIEKLGRDIHRRNAYAARATDILYQALGGDAELLEQGIRGWIVREQNDGALVRFVKRTSEGYRPAFDITFDAAGRGSIKEATGALSPPEAAQFKARQQAMQSIPKFYSPHYNTVVLPDVDGDGFLVYALAASMDPDHVVITGHYRITVSADGTAVERVDKLFNSFLVLSKKDAARGMPEGSELAAMTTSHVVSDTPIETHVFINLLHAMPLYILTPNGDVWLIEKGRISRQGNMADYVK